MLLLLLLLPPLPAVRLGLGRTLLALLLWAYLLITANETAPKHSPKNRA